MKRKIAVIGGGSMGGALIEGFLRSGGLTRSDIVVGTPDLPGQERFRGMGLAVYADNERAVRDADVVIIAVKPWLVGEVSDRIGVCLKDGALVVSVAGGVSLEKLESHFGSDSACFRVMPNVAASLGASMTFVACRERYEQYAPAVLELFGSVGETALIPEDLMDSAMITASCGTAYALRYLRAAMEAGIEMGLSADLARRSIAQTLKGAAELMLAGDLHPEAAIDRVTTPGGSTIVGLNALERCGFTAAVIEGHLAVYRRLKGK